MTGELTLAADPTNALHAATRQYVLAVRDALVDGAPGVLDTLKEIADQLATDESGLAALVATVAGKQPSDADLTAIANLSTTTFGRELLTAADAPALRLAAGLGSGGSTGAVLTKQPSGAYAPSPKRGVYNALDYVESGLTADEVYNGVSTGADVTNALLAAHDAGKLVGRPFTLILPPGGDYRLDGPGGVPIVATGGVSWGLPITADSCRFDWRGSIVRTLNRIGTFFVSGPSKVNGASD